MMARSFKDLLEFLLAEISLCGDQGASTSDISKFIDDFYSVPDQAPVAADDTEPATRRHLNVDRKFKQKVWSWLTRHPEVSVGAQREGNDLTLDEVEAHSAPQNGSRNGSDNSATHDVPDNQTPGEQPPSSGPVGAENAEVLELSPPTKKNLRVFVSQLRMWLAITGHEPDTSKVLAMEFVLLSIIASRKEKGILQSDLVRLSGQDKRSVPKRTDGLSQKGYIEKRAIQFKSARTSLCTLRKFVPPSTASAERDVFVPCEDASGDQQRSMVDFDALLAKIFDCLKKYQVITLDDLKWRLEMQERWRAKVLRKAIQRLEAIGCVRRVKAMSEYSANQRPTHLSIMLIREPTESDRKMFYEHLKNLAATQDQGEEDKAEAEDDGDIEDIGREPSTGVEDSDKTVANLDLSERSAHRVPQWTPDRNLANLVLDLVDRSGSEGMTNSNIMESCMGGFYRRPMEVLLSRLVDSWQFFQPPHLRHLSVVRDTALRGTNFLYVHYSFLNFAALVESGQASWEAVEREHPGKGAAQPREIGSKPELDEYGFPLNSLPKGLFKGGNASLAQCLGAAQPPNYRLSYGDPRLVEYDNGTYELQFHEKWNELDSGRDRDFVEGGSYVSGAGRKRKFPTEEKGFAESQAETPGRKRKKILNTKADKFEGLSEKEKLKAQGFDESWTEYSILTLERPHNGIFITPPGKRMPTGKARGRPPKSRIAVIKTPRLAEFAWFRLGDISDEAAASVEMGGQSTTVNDTDERPGGLLPATGQQPMSGLESRPIEQADEGPPPRPLESPVIQTEATAMDVSGQPMDVNESPMPKKRKRSDLEDNADAGDHPEVPRQPPKRRGRPPKKPKVAPVAADLDNLEQAHAKGQSDKAGGIVNTESVAPAPPKRRGRSPKKRLEKAPEAAPKTKDIAEPRPATSNVSPGAPLGSPDRFKLADENADKRRESPQAEATELAPSTPPLPKDREVDAEKNRENVDGNVEEGATGNVEPPQSDQIPLITPDKEVEEVQPSSQVEAEQTTPNKETSAAQDSRPDVTKPGNAETDANVAEMHVDAHAQEPARPLIERAAAGSRLTPSDLEGVQPSNEEDVDLRSSVEVSTVNDIGRPSGEPEQGKRQTSELVSKLRTPDFDTQSMASVKGRRKFKKQSVRTGSVSVLRQKIVMDIIEKAGGVYPLGTELWYPFTTAWLARQTGKPDTRTVRTTARTLIEAGKLRKVTFSGKNAKGFIVTKSLVAKPDISSNDPRVLDMQRSMLLADPQYYIPPEVDVDPALRKSNPAVMQTLRKNPEVRPDIMVTLHQKPAQIPTGISRKRALGTVDDAAVAKHPKVRRLQSTRRRVPPGALSVFSIFGDDTPAELPIYIREQHAAPFRQRYPIIAKAHISRLMMSPHITFHPSSGTFGTGVREIGRPRRKSMPVRPSGSFREIPGTLEGIFSSKRKRRIGAKEYTDPITSRFFSEVDAVRSWENVNPEIFEVGGEGLKYVNHVAQGSFESAPIEGRIRFHSDDLSMSKEEEEAELIHKAQNMMYRPIQAAVSPRPTPSQLPQAPKVSQVPQALQAPRVPQAAQVPTKRRLAQLQGKSSNKAAPDRSTPVKRSRALKSLPEDMTQRLMAAIIVARTLAGGTEARMVDWLLVAPLFPDVEFNLLTRRGRNIMTRHRLQLAKMQSDFQEKFAEAYEKGQVPPINYDNLESYDWEWAINWAQTQLDVLTATTDKLPSLPATREQFDSLFEMRKEPMQVTDEIYQHGVNITVPRKQASYSSTLFSVPLGKASASSGPSISSNERFDVAKTWVRANVITADETYNAPEARRVLEHLGDGLIGQAIHSLNTDRVILMGNRGRVTPGRNYDVTEYFLNALGRKRPIESAQMKRASFFKTNVLDPQLHLEGSCDVNFGAEDGDVLALINLFSEGRVTLSPRNPPNDKYGLTDGGYLTRQMDKGKLRFDVEVHAVPGRYVYGNPIKKRIDNTPIPRGGLPAGFPGPEGSSEPLPLCKIPVWFDIHGKFVSLIWDLAVCAVSGVLATRPGLSTAGLGQVFHPHIGEWEVGLILQWLADIGVVERGGDSNSDSSWVLKEWWWMVVQG